MVDKVALGQVFPSTSPSPANLHSIIWGWYNRPAVASVPKVAPQKKKSSEETITMANNNN
jgi:hypothetical protein